MRILVKLLVNIIALWVVAYILPGFTFDTPQTIAVTAVVIGVVNTFIKPLAQFIALPLTLLTLGIAYFFVNVFLLWGVSFVVPGFNIDSFLTSVLGSLALTLVSSFLNKIVRD